MAIVAGKEGYIKVGSVTTSAVISIDNWSLDMAADAIDVTAFGGGTAVAVKSFDYGLKSATGSLAGHYNSTDNNIEGFIDMLADGTAANVYIDLAANSGSIASISAVVTGITVGQAVADKTTVSINFTVDGGVTWS
jgi:hypothetical protein